MKFVQMSWQFGTMDGKLHARVLVWPSILISIVAEVLMEHHKLARVATGLTTIQQYSNKLVQMLTAMHTMIQQVHLRAMEILRLDMKLFSVHNKKSSGI